MDPHNERVKLFATLIYLATMAISLVAGLVGGLIFGWEPFL
jgi:hypothetical protein